MCVLLAMEAQQLHILDPPLAAAPFAQLARIKLLQVTVLAITVLLVIQALSQAVFLPRLVIHALLVILAV